ncbi:MAG: DUF167 domain-containing protein [Ignavibacteriales bacterium]|nr:DUF167 domain-containing protein [Ignavibacteriales bacterium]
MKLKVKVKPYSSRERVDQLADGSLVIHVNAPPAEGKANERVIEVLAEYFKRPKRNVIIRSGFKGRHKIVEIM